MGRSLLIRKGETPLEFRASFEEKSTAKPSPIEFRLIIAQPLFRPQILLHLFSVRSHASRCASGLESTEIERQVVSWQVPPPAARNAVFTIVAGLADSFSKKMSTLSDLAHDRVYGPY